MTTHIGSTIKFSDLCKVFETTCESKKQDKSAALSVFLKQYREKASKLKAENSNAGTSFYPVLRLILPQADRARGSYGLKEFTLAKRFIKVLCLPPQGADAVRLTNFRTSGNNSNIRDFADAAYWVLRKHFLDGSKLSITRLNEYLDAIAEENANNNPRGVDEQLHKLLQETSPEEQKWLIRIILKDLRLGMGQDRILKVYHPDAVDLFSANNSLAKMCDTLPNPSIRLHEIEVEVFSPFRPMLSQRCDVAQFRKIFAGNPNLYIENKFDGERFQLHMENGQFKYFSRNGYDYSSTYGVDFSTGLYTPQLKGAFKPHVKRIILDGEMMGWNTKTKKFGSKGMNFDVKKLTTDTTHQPCLCVFDILLLNDKVLTGKPLRERLLLLDTVFTPVQGIIVKSHRIEATSRQEILDSLNKSMDREEEGIVFKDVNSLYKMNDRHAGWWKMKLEYFENVMSDLDVLIIGGYYGEGRRRQQISGFLMGVAVPSTDASSHLPSAYLSFARIASGLSDDELQVVNDKLGPHWKKLNEGNPEKYGLRWGKEKPDVWIPPSKSCVVLVRASELIYSSDFKTERTLRFPRIQKVRLDKPYYDSLTTTELQELTGTTQSVRKLTKRHLELEDLEDVEKERKIRRRYVNPEVQPVEQISDLLMGHQFCVLTGCDEWKKDVIETTIRENGGTVVKNEGPETLCILVGDDHPRVNSCKEYDAPYDLVKLQWLRNVLDTGVFKNYEPTDMLHTSKNTRERFLTEYDKYGDSYLEDATLDSLQKNMDQIQKSNDYIYPTSSEIKDLQEKLNFVDPLSKFSDCVAFFDNPKNSCKTEADDTNSSLLGAMTFVFLGGTVSDVLDENVTLVVMNESNDSRKNEIMDRLHDINNAKAKIVDKDFIDEHLTEAVSRMHRLQEL